MVTMQHQFSAKYGINVKFNTTAVETKDGSDELFYIKYLRPDLVDPIILTVKFQLSAKYSSSSALVIDPVEIVILRFSETNVLSVKNSLSIANGNLLPYSEYSCTAMPTVAGTSQA